MVFKLKQCPKCKEYLSEDSYTYFCTTEDCDYEEMKSFKPIWRDDD